MPVYRAPFVWLAGHGSETRACIRIHFFSLVEPGMIKEEGGKEREGGKFTSLDCDAALRDDNFFYCFFRFSRHCIYIYIYVRGIKV